MARNSENNNRDRLLNRKMSKPEEAKKLDDSQKGIKLFFGEKMWKLSLLSQIIY